MVAELKPPKRLAPADVRDLMRGYLRQGKTAHDAAAAVIADMRAVGLTDELLDVVGPAGIAAIWRAGGEKIARPRVLRPEIEPFVRPGAPPQRRVDVAQLQANTSLLEGMHQIAGRWVRLGDMDRVACRAAALHFKATCLEHAHQARYFYELAKALNGGEQVRQRFDDAALMRLWDIAGRDG
jgi:hypothetical protein